MGKYIKGISEAFFGRYQPGQEAGLAPGHLSKVYVFTCLDQNEACVICFHFDIINYFCERLRLCILYVSALTFYLLKES